MASSSNNIVPENFPINRFLRSIIDLLRQEWISECDELCRILETVHLRKLFTVVDCIARQIYDLDDNSSITTTNHDSIVLTGGGGKKRKLHRQHKIVNVIKSNEPLGVTVRFDDCTGDVLLARILVGGAAHRSGLVQLGDRILEVNGIVLRGRSHLEAINILQRECRNTVVTFKIAGKRPLSTGGEDLIRPGSFMVKAHFDYDPCHDAQIPCAQIGLEFQNGTILNVLNRDDPDWWQASKEIEPGTGRNKARMEIFQIAGLIPSQSRQERRMVAQRDIKSQLDRNRNLRLFGGLMPLPVPKTKWTVQKIKKIMYDLADCIQYDREEICAYEPVARYFPPPDRCRPIVLIGADGVECSRFIQSLCEIEPNYRQPLMHTSRFRRFQENDGIDFYFVNEEWMETEIDSGRFIFYYKFRENYYGIHRDTIKQIIENGFVCLFHLPARFLRLIYTAQFKPYLIFIRPEFDIEKLIESRGPFQDHRDWLLHHELAHLTIYESHKLNILYGHKFDSIVVVKPNAHQDARASEIVREIIRSVQQEPTWVPATWINQPIR